MRVVKDLEAHGQLVRIRTPIDPYLELAEIQRRAYRSGAKALLFENVKGTRFPCLANLFGTRERARFIFRHTLDLVELAVQMKADPAGFARNSVTQFFKQPLTYMKLPFTGMASLPHRVSIARAPVMANTTTIDQLPLIQSWPNDGGPFVTLPQVFSQDPRSNSVMRSNLGMYRIQMLGNDYERNREVGVHYQIHRGLGIHHAIARDLGRPLPVSIFVGGHPAHTVAAVMPLPENLSELIFGGMLAGRRFRYTRDGDAVISSEADFCITGTIQKAKLEGPFGDHLGYYSLAHEFPVLKVDKVYHRSDAIWPFTVVGRPPQEDTTFGELIHEITKPMVPVSLPGVAALHAVDAAGVHPLLLAIGSERYTPYATSRPQELLTQANAILGFNQCSLAKYLLIVNGADEGCPKVDDVEAMFGHVLERIDFRRDLHFQTKTTIDTLDYSGEGLNEGSKLVMAAAGARCRRLKGQVPGTLKLPDGFCGARLAGRGILAIQGPKFGSYATVSAELNALAAELAAQDLEGIALIVLCDDSEFCARSFNNFLWVTFTRSNPSHDCHGVESFTEFKHWGCRGPLIIDARLKPRHAPPLIEDRKVSSRVDELCRRGGPLHGIVE